HVLGAFRNLFCDYSKKLRPRPRAGALAACSRCFTGCWRLVLTGGAGRRRRRPGMHQLRSFLGIGLRTAGSRARGRSISGVLIRESTLRQWPIGASLLALLICGGFSSLGCMTPTVWSGVLTRPRSLVRLVPQAIRARGAGRAGAGLHLFGCAV